MSTNECVDRALEILGKGGHCVQTNPGADLRGGELHVTIDGVPRSVHEILAATEQPEETWAFEAHGKRQNLLYYFPQGGQTFELYEEGKMLGERQPVPRDEGYFEHAQRTCLEMSGTSLWRL